MRSFVARRLISTHIHLDNSGASFNSCGDPLFTLSILGHPSAITTHVILHNRMRNNQRTSNIDLGNQLIGCNLLVHIPEKVPFTAL